MFHGLEGKTVLVTGGSRGIGKSIVSMLANYKLNVAFTYCSQETDIEALKKTLSVDSGKINQYKMDIENKLDIDTVIRKVEQDFGTINFLVNNAGVNRDGYMMMMSDQNWNKVIETDLTGTFMVTKRILPILMSNKEGAIVNISSVAGIQGVIGQTNYCAAKAGLIGMTKALAREIAHKNIRINSIAPGYVKTDMVDKIDPRMMESIIQKIPQKRIALAEEIASVVLFLLSDGASYITGSTIVVDGGLTS